MVNLFVNNVSVDCSKLQNDYVIDLRLTWIKRRRKTHLMFKHKSWNVDSKIIFLMQW